MKVQLYVAGKTFYEYMEAVDYSHARQIALARNPGATVIGCNADYSGDDNSGGFFSSSSSSSATTASSSSDGGDIGGYFGLAVLIGMAWAAFTFLPWVVMGFAGMIGAWIGKQTGRTSLIILLALLAGGAGYYQGDKWHGELTEFFATEEVQDN
jgi:hypothetical protein